MINRTNFKMPGHVKNMAQGVGTRVLHTAVSQQTGAGKPLDPGLGWRLLRDGRIPVGTKIASLALGAALMVVLQVLEIPIQSLIALALPLVGFILDGVIDGTEAILGPILIGSLLLPHLASKELVAQIRQEPTGKLRRVN